MDIDQITNKEEKMELAKIIADKVRNGQTIGFGSGTTSYLAAIEIGKKVKAEELRITAVPTSNEIEQLCEELGISCSNLLESTIDWGFDGADEVDKRGRLIKGRGAAMFKEKLNIVSSPKTYILVDHTKFVDKLGEKCPVPIEVFPTAMNFVSSRLEQIGAIDIEFRGMTENGNSILDTRFDDISDDLERRIKIIPGVIESGLFVGYNTEIIGLDL